MAGLLASILTFPYAPVRVVTSLAKVLHREAERELYGSASIRRQLEELDAAFAAGAMSEAEYEQAQQAVLDRLAGRPGPAP
ncbi:MAG TPA: gas vesicle protein GvpG [Micromonosporaceae bacterium]